MPPVDEIPDLCARIRAALDAAGRPSGLAPAFGRMLRVLAASKSSGHNLCFGKDSGEAGAWMLDGMDFRSGLVVVVTQPEDLTLLQPEFDRDVRASLHHQDVASFLRDVKAHRFNLIVDRLGGEHPETLRLALGMLRPGGFCVVTDSGDTVARALEGCASDAQNDAASQPALAAEEFSVAAWDGAQAFQLVVRRTAMPQRRRSRR